MGTSTIPHAKLMASIRQFCDSLLDCDRVLDDADRAVSAALEEQERARQERNRVALHLQRLVDLYDEAESTSATFGPEIAGEFVSQLEARG